MQKLRWGILGAGGIAGAFARALPQSRPGRLVAVASRSADKAQAFADQHKAERAHGSYEALLSDPDVDAVYIATPHTHHAAWAIRTAEARKHILCEKPAAVNLPQTMALLEAVHEHDVFFMEAFMYRCHPQTARLVELLRSGTLGTLQLVRAEFSFRCAFDLKSRLLNHDLAGGGILDVGCYPVSFACLVAGIAQGGSVAEPDTVAGAARIGPDSRVDEVASAVLGFKGGLIAELATGVQLNRDNTARIYGTEGTLIVPSPWFGCREAGTAELWIDRPGAEREIVRVPSDRNIYAIEADTVAEHLDARQSPSPAMSWADTLATMRTLDRWRAAVGLVYDFETGAHFEPVAARPLRQRPRPGAPIPQRDVPGVSRPVSRLVMGAMLEGAGSLRSAHAYALWDDFFERGGNCFDTAYIYWGGASDETLGHWMERRGIRNETIVIGKGAHTPHCDPESIHRQLDESLNRLRTDCIDIYFMHRDNPAIPAGEFVQALNEEHQRGRIKLFGGSNWALDRVDAANAYAADHGLIGFGAVSNQFSLARMIEPPWHDCRSASDPASRAWFERTQTPLFAWSSQARGFFVFGDPDHRSDRELVRCWYSDDNFQRLERVRALARERGVAPLNIAAAYVLHQPFPVFALIGPRSIEETRTALHCLQVQLTPAELAWLNLAAEREPALA